MTPLASIRRSDWADRDEVHRDISAIASTLSAMAAILRGVTVSSKARIPTSELTTMNSP